jgi:CRISPR-associated protein Cas1
VYYWQNLFKDVLNNLSPAPLLENERVFLRDRFGKPPNNLLNYGYAILRAMTARALISSGLLPTFGIHHKNKYNAYCLADYIMEPYRPFVDKLVLGIIAEKHEYEELTPSLKKKLLTIPVLNTIIEENVRPMMVALSHTTASVAACFLSEKRKILYPLML